MKAGGTAWFLLACACAGVAEKWQWPEGAGSVRIDHKVHFDNGQDTREHNKNTRNLEILSDNQQFEEPVNTVGFYNRPPGVGRYPVKIEAYNEPDKIHPDSVYNLKKTSQQYYSDGTLDSIQFCKCVTTPDCNPTVDSTKACSFGKHLCCYNRENKSPQYTSEYFNEVENERPILLTGQAEHARPLPPPPGTGINGGYNFFNSHNPGDITSPEKQPIHVGHNRPTSNSDLRQDNRPVLVGPEGPSGIIGPGNPNRGVLVGPEGPTGIIGPKQQNQAVLAGPGGPTGIIGPAQQHQGFLFRPGAPVDTVIPNHQAVLVGPGGPTGTIGPTHQNQAVLVGPKGPSGIIDPIHKNQAVLVGPGGPTGIIGPGNKGHFIDDSRQDIGLSETAQRPILVGPGGPTGIIGPAGYGRQPVLVGPGGPTGIIGPYGRTRTPVLVGPDGPTGLIGPLRRRYFGK